jgi:nucleotide-binding universal stress UspA family protein
MSVVVAVDASGSSWNAIRVAAKEAGWRRVRLIAVTPYRADPATANPPVPGSGIQTTDGSRVAEAALRGVLSDALGENFDEVDVRAVAGLAGEAIVETAREARAQLIVLAARVGIATLPGTLSQYVLDHAQCPVLLVPAGRRPD